MLVWPINDNKKNRKYVIIRSPWVVAFSWYLLGIVHEVEKYLGKFFEENACSQLQHFVYLSHRDFWTENKKIPIKKQTRGRSCLKDDNIWFNFERWKVDRSLYISYIKDIHIIATQGDHTICDKMFKIKNLKVRVTVITAKCVKFQTW